MLPAEGSRNVTPAAACELGRSPSPRSLLVPLPQPLRAPRGLRKHRRDENSGVSVSELASFNSWKFVRRYSKSCIHNYIWQPCIIEKMKWHVYGEAPKERCSKFWRAAGTFPRLIWLLSPVEGELELFWIILCQISRLTKWIWLTYEKRINPCFIPNGSLSPEMIVNSTYFGLEHLQRSWKQFLKH